MTEDFDQLVDPSLLNTTIHLDGPPNSDQHTKDSQLQDAAKIIGLSLNQLTAFSHEWGIKPEGLVLVAKIINQNRPIFTYPDGTPKGDIGKIPEGFIIDYLTTKLEERRQHLANIGLTNNELESYDKMDVNKLLEELNRLSRLNMSDPVKVQRIAEAIKYLKETSWLWK